MKPNCATRPSADTNHHENKLAASVIIHNKDDKLCISYRRTEQSLHHRDTSHEALLHYTLCNTPPPTLQPAFLAPRSNNRDFKIKTSFYITA